MNKELKVNLEEAILIELLKNGYEAQEANYITDKMIRYFSLLEKDIKIKE
jgi:hypothetical protein